MPSSFASTETKRLSFRTSVAPRRIHLARSCQSSDKNGKKNLKFLFIFHRFVQEDLCSLLTESAKVLKEKGKGGECEAPKMPVSLILAALGICKRILYVDHFCFSVCIICKVFLKTVFKQQPFDVFPSQNKLSIPLIKSYFAASSPSLCVSSLSLSLYLGINVYIVCVLAD